MQYESSVEWVRNLEDLSEAQWRTSIAKGKWTIAEIIGHLPAWDQFIIDQRLPYLFNDRTLPKGPEVNELNEQSSIESRRKSKKEIILKFITVRRSLIITINNIEDSLWDKQIEIGEHKLSLFEYLKGMVEHDEHHFNQIQQVLDTFDALHK